MPRSVLRWLVLAMAVSVPSGSAAQRTWGHLPRALARAPGPTIGAYLPAPQLGGRRTAHCGNANSPAAQAELAALAARVTRLLVDPPPPYPWRRTVRTVAAHGAVPDDGKLDDAALKRAITEACDASSARCKERDTQ